MVLKHEGLEGTWGILGLWVGNLQHLKATMVLKHEGLEGTWGILGL